MKVYIVVKLDNKTNRKRYQERKEQIRNEAIDWQRKFSDGETMFWSEIAEAGDYFCRMGKRYGLLREFRENCIC